MTSIHTNHRAIAVAATVLTITAITAPAVSARPSQPPYQPLHVNRAASTPAPRARAASIPGQASHHATANPHGAPITPAGSSAPPLKFTSDGKDHIRAGDLHSDRAGIQRLRPPRIGHTVTPAVGGGIGAAGSALTAPAANTISSPPAVPGPLHHRPHALPRGHHLSLAFRVGARPARAVNDKRLAPELQRIHQLCAQLDPLAHSTPIDLGDDQASAGDVATA
jgi:hypothetical protein